MTGDAIRHPLLESLGVHHGFGTVDSGAPPGLRRPRQVHGAGVAFVEAPGDRLGEADAVVSRAPGVPIGVVTADCVPILAAADGGIRVAAIHAGWRGLASGVVEAGIAALRRISSPQAEVAAVVGPHIGSCCYEVDGPVLEALAPRFGDGLAGAARPTRAGHAQLDLGLLAARALSACGLPRDRIGAIPAACTRCDATRFHSYRRDGARAGRLVHFVLARDGQA